MQTYRTLTGYVLDLSTLTGEQHAFFDCCFSAYRQSMDWDDFATLITGPDNPLVRAADGWVTRIVYDHPLFQAVRDLEDRLGLQQGRLSPDGEVMPDSDPLTDEWLPVSEAARRKGVTVSAVHQAIQRGALIAHPAKPGGSWLLVSAASLDAWSPNPRRQAAARRAAAAR